MVFATIHRSLCTRLVAAFIVMLVVSPYSEPFATLDGTDFGGAGAVDIGGSSKLKTSAQDALPSPLVVAVFIDVAPSASRRIMRPATLDSRGHHRAILRL